MAKKKDYALKGSTKAKRKPAPSVPYEPPAPKRFRAKIGLIGCGGIAASHLASYRKAGWDVVAFCDRQKKHATELAAAYSPKADIYTDHTKLLARDDINVIDAATHPAVRAEIIADAIRAGKHVLSQKPFVLDLAVGKKLVKLADKHGVYLAVNQNGRWAPHVSYIRHAIAKGVIGDVMGAHLSVHWDHGWIQGTPFDKIRHVILYDFAIHWFDMLNCFLPDRKALSVTATLTQAPNQKAKPPLLAQAMVEFEGAQASLAFDASLPHGAQDRTFVSGTKGSISSVGPNLGKQKVTVDTANIFGSPKLKGSWFDPHFSGFRGTMGELLRAIETRKEPGNSARNNLRSLEMAFAAMRSADTGRPQVPGRVRTAAV